MIVRVCMYAVSDNRIFRCVLASFVTGLVRHALSENQPKCSRATDSAFSFIRTHLCSARTCYIAEHFTLFQFLTSQAHSGVWPLNTNSSLSPLSNNASPSPQGRAPGAFRKLQLGKFKENGLNRPFFKFFT